MKKAFGLIAATLVSTSVYSQSYESNSSPAQPTDPAAQKEQTPDYSSRQSESGAPASGEFSSSSSSSGYEKSPGLSSGNSSTGQSSGANVSEDKTLTTRDSDVSGSEYRGSTQSEPERSFNAELSAESEVHVPAAPVREGSKSEGWSTAGTFSGAGPGSISGSSSSSTSPDATPGVSSNRDDDLSSRGLEPDSNQLSQQGDIDDDHVLIFEDWTTSDRNEAVGGPAGSDTGSGSSSSVSVDSSGSDSDYAMDLHQRVQHDWSSRLGSDIPATPLFDRSLDELSRTPYSTDDSVGAPAGSVSGSASKADSDAECDTHKAKGGAAGYEVGTVKGDSDFDGSVRSSGSADTSAPSDYGDRSYDDGHISGNNSASSSSDSDDNSVKQPDL